MKKTCTLLICAASLLLAFAGCGEKAQDIVFTGTIEEIYDRSILVSTTDDVGFDRARVWFPPDTKIGFNILVGQLVRITILPQIAESEPVQVTAVAIELVADPAAPDPERADYTASFYRADSHTDGGWAFIREQAANSDMMVAGSVRHIYTIDIDSRQALSDFMDEGMKFFPLDFSYDNSESLLKAAEKYDAAFFDKNKLLILVAEESSGSIRHKIIDTTISGDALSIAVETIVPEDGTADMADWFIVLEFSRDEIAGCDTFDAYYGGSSAAVPQDEENWPEAAPKYEESADVRMETQYSVYPEGTMTVLVKWFNESENALLGGEPFTLEKLVDGIWRTVQKETDIKYAFTLGGYPLLPGVGYWQSYNLIPYTDGLNAGKYRISAEIIVDYPECIQVYGSFEVGAAAEPRHVTHKDGTYEYVNTDYGFVLTLTPDWEGCTAEIAEGTGDDTLDAVMNSVGEEWHALRLRHPDWSEDAPYQDIVFACLSHNARSTGAVLTEDIRAALNALSEGFSAGAWTLYSADSTLDSTLPGYSAAVKALETIVPIW